MPDATSNSTADTPAGGPTVPAPEVARGGARRGAPGRVVVVLGATSGIGLAAARGFAQLGDRLVLNARSADSLESAAQSCTRLGAAQVDTVAGDIADKAQVGKVVSRTLELHGRIDVLVLSAATMAYGTVEAVPDDVFESVVRTAVFGTLHVAQAVLPVFRRQHAGVLIVVNSLLGSITVPTMGAYATSKWGQRGLVRTLQEEVRDERGIKVCLVSPGSINTPIYYQAANFVGRDARPPWPVRAPEKVGEVIVKLADRPQLNVSVPIGPFNPLIISGYRLFPFVYDRIVGRLFRLASLRGRRDTTSGNVPAPQPQLERMHGRWPEPPA